MASSIASYPFHYSSTMDRFPRHLSFAEAQIKLPLEKNCPTNITQPRLICEHKIDCAERGSLTCILQHQHDWKLSWHDNQDA